MSWVTVDACDWMDFESGQVHDALIVFLRDAQKNGLGVTEVSAVANEPVRIRFIVLDGRGFDLNLLKTGITIEAGLVFVIDSFDYHDPMNGEIGGVGLVRYDSKKYHPPIYMMMRGVGK